MHTRERGAAHINVYYFLVMLLLFFGAVGWAYFEMSQKREAQQSLETAVAERKKGLDELAVYKVYAKSMESLGELGTFNPPESLSDVEPLLAVAHPKKLQDRMGDLARKLTLPGAAVENLAGLCAAVADRVDSLTKAKEAAELAQTTAETRLAEASGKYQGDVTKANADLGEASKSFTSRVATLDSEIRRKEGVLQASRKETSAVREEMNQEKDKHTQVVLGRDKEINKRNLQLAHMSRTVSLINSPKAADGEVVSASMASRLAFINRGSKDMLKPGVRFRIYGRPTQKVPNPPVKAVGLVTKVMDDRAEMRLLDVRDALEDPVLSGDQIRNELYSPNMRRTIALVGAFNYPYNRPLVKSLLERLGNKVVNEVTGPGIDLVVVGSDEFNAAGELVPVKDHPGYKKAEELFVEIVPLSRLYDLLQISN